jgi:riboflavin synthase
MFTGLVEEVGAVESITGNQDAKRMVIRAQKVLDGVKIGDSIAVNGICLTVTAHSTKHFHVDVMPETLRHTNLRELKRGQSVNVERALRLGDRFGGHLVSGHIDGTGTILSRQLHANAVLFRIKASNELLRYMIPRGSICIDGISLTLVEVTQDSFSVSIIPHTLASTSLQDRKPGDVVNVETDMIGKYVERLLHPFKADQTNAHVRPGGLNLAFLQENGFA